MAEPAVKILTGETGEQEVAAHLDAPIQAPAQRAETRRNPGKWLIHSESIKHQNRRLG
jgi:hypothetical protein